MDVGIIGLGDIAVKAYLPVITTRDINLHLCSRDPNKLNTIGRQYRITNLHSNIDSLISAGIDAAFVHTATSSHEEIVRKLLENDINVYVDKPVTDSYDTTAELVDLARQKKLLLKAGFNRRYAPAYARLKDVGGANMILMQKNRKSLPGKIRTFIFDDFIHVVDTLLFLLNNNEPKIHVEARIEGQELYHLVVNFTVGKTTAVGIMNRDAGVTEERLEIFSPNEKRVIIDLTDQNKNPWQTTLKTRGFEDMIDDFLSMRSDADYDAILRTHKICETIVHQLENRKL
jgi:virulence factor